MKDASSESNNDAKRVDLNNSSNNDKLSDIDYYREGRRVWGKKKFMEKL